MKKRVLSAILTLCMLVSLLPGMNLKTVAAGPTTISSVADLEAFRDAVNGGENYAGQTVTLTKNLDLSGIANWTPIGNYSYAFRGTFNGQGHIIYNLTINTSNGYCGLFGKIVNATISNLGLENATVVSTATDVAALAGNAQGGTIERCWATGSVKGYAGVGGILGSTHSSSYPTTIKNCYARVALTGTGARKDIAGISGWNQATSVKIENCLSACTGEDRPIAGWSDGSAVSNGQITNTYFDKTLSPNFSSESGRTDLGKTSAELKTAATFAGWDFASIWTIDPGVNGGYPYLQGFTPGLSGAPSSISVTVKDTNDNPVEDADVYITDGTDNITLNHQGNGIYSGTVDTKDGAYQIYVNGKVAGSLTQDGSGAVSATVTVESTDEKGIFAGRYSYRQVFDCQRSPTEPQAGKQFKVSGFKEPMNAVASTAANSRVRFEEIEIQDKMFYFKETGDEQAPFSLYMTDKELGTVETLVSVKGNIYGLGAKGFLYISGDTGSGGNLGYFISNEEGYQYGDGFTYVPDITGPITVEQAEEYDAANMTPQEKVLTAIEVKTAPAKTDYKEGETFAPTGLVLTLKYDNSSTKEVAYTSENAKDFLFTPSLSERLMPTNTAVTIEYGGKTTSQAITVSAKTLSSIAVKTEPTKTTYIEGNTFNPTGLVITLTYDNGATEEVSYAGNESSFTFAPSTSTALTTANTKVAITYGGKTAEQTITVNPKSVVSITETQQTKTYNGNPQSFDIKGTALTGFTVAYKVNNAYVTTAPTDAGNYDVKVTRAEDAEYKAYEKIITSGLAIAKATPQTVTFPTASAITYGMTLSASTLTGGSGDGTFAWTDGTTIPTVTNSGYQVTFTPNDTKKLRLYWRNAYENGCNYRKQGKSELYCSKQSHRDLRSDA